MLVNSLFLIQKISLVFKIHFALVALSISGCPNKEGILPKSNTMASR